MESEKWVAVEVIYGDIQAELLRGLLEAQGITVLLSQEGAGHNVYPVLMGPLAKVEVLVQNSDLAAAKEIVAKYRAGEYRKEELQGGQDAGEGETTGEKDTSLDEDS